MVSFVAEWKAAVRSPILVAGGDVPGVDIATLLERAASAGTAQSRPYIPATSWKGRLRHVCEAIARGWGVLVCRAPDPPKCAPVAGCRGAHRTRDWSFGTAKETTAPLALYAAFLAPPGGPRPSG
jgi:CRISPR/Cas system CSM-associated protein Csm3 (group 7 of RAMP superfamily)